MTRFWPFFEFEKKPWSYFGAFGGIWGQILYIAKTGQITRQNEAFDVNFFEKIVSRSFKVIQDQKSRKNVEKCQISNIMKIRQFITENEHWIFLELWLFIPKIVVFLWKGAWEITIKRLFKLEFLTFLVQGF